MDWLDKAACKGQTEVMFPLSYKQNDPQVVLAKSICGSCTVRKPCLAYALSFPAADMHGIWAGLTPSQLERKQRGKGPSRPSIGKSWKDAKAGS
jgi:WhiB family redox-sensing transcriptional regulator